jgi:broad specificity phosphatase PhoE
MYRLFHERDVAEFKERVREATATVWQEFDYRVDVCRVTHGSHIEIV